MSSEFLSLNWEQLKGLASKSWALSQSASSSWPSALAPFEDPYSLMAIPHRSWLSTARLCTPPWSAWAWTLCARKVHSNLFLPQSQRSSQCPSRQACPEPCLLHRICSKPACTSGSSSWLGRPQSQCGRLRCYSNCFPWSEGILRLKNGKINEWNLPAILIIQRNFEMSSPL